MSHHFNFNLKRRLTVQMGTLVVLSGLTLTLIVYALSNLEGFSSLKNDFDELHIYILQAKRTEKDIIMRDIYNLHFYDSGVRSSGTKKMALLLNKAKTKIQKLDNNAFIAKIGFRDSLKSISNNLSAYEEGFLNLMKLNWEKGFKDWGHEGAMHQAIHEIETSPLSPYNKVMLLNLRQAEKDFLHRKDTAYINLFNQYLSAFKKFISPQERSLVEKYASEFHIITDLEKKIGLNPTLGQTGKMQASFNALEPTIDNLSNLIHEHYRSIWKNTMYTIIALGSTQIALGIWLMVLFVKRTTLRVSSHLTESFKQSEELVIESKKQVADLNQQYVHNLEQIAFMVAHRFRSPICSLGGLIHILGRTEKTSPEFDKTIDLLEHVSTQLNQMSHELSSYVQTSESMLAEKLDKNATPDSQKPRG